MRHRFACLALLVALAAPAGAQNPDFDQNGSTDVLWTNAAGDSSLVAWRMDGHVRLEPDPVITPSAPIDANWKVGCVADFNSDHRPDILWRNTTSGLLVVWQMNYQANTPPTPPDYFREDGFFLTLDAADVTLLQDPAWRLVSCADVGSVSSNDPDDKTDVVFQNDLTGEILFWYFVNRNHTGSAYAPTPSDPGWKLRAVREFGASAASSAADDHVDFLFQNQTSKKMVVWFMEGTSKNSGAFTNPQLPIDLNWDLVAAGDLGTSFSNAATDELTDLVFRNSTSGRIVVWFMNGLTRLEGGYMEPDLFEPPDESDPFDWVLIAPR